MTNQIFYYKRKLKGGWNRSITEPRNGYEFKGTEEEFAQYKTDAKRSGTSQGNINRQQSFKNRSERGQGWRKGITGNYSSDVNNEGVEREENYIGKEKADDDTNKE